jgi:S-DNA-T family DNA segregation ATPase FtsK/SpoIIIE
VAGLVFVAGWWLRASHPGAAVPVAGITAAVCAAVSALAAWTRFRLRVYVAVVTAIGGGWLSAATAFGPMAGKLPTLWMVGAVAGAVPWWAHRRRRARVRVERALEAWPGLAETLIRAGPFVDVPSAHGDDTRSSEPSVPW